MAQVVGEAVLVQVWIIRAVAVVAQADILQTVVMAVVAMQLVQVLLMVVAAVRALGECGPILTLGTAAAVRARGDRKHG